MSDDTLTLTGPDLALGVPSAALVEGAPLTGHFRGEAILIMRRGAEILAVNAVCTHYSGRLSDGLVVGDTVRCPLHHACFSLRTGEALGAPALASIACYDVADAEGMVRLTGKRAEAAAAPALGGGAEVPGSVVIIGSGAAGESCAEELRRRGYAGLVTMVDQDPDEPVDRPNLSKDFLAGTAEEAWLPLRPADFFRVRHVDRVVGRIIAIDPAAHSITLQDGATLSYGALLIATGASPVRLPAGSSGALPILYLRTMADSRAIIAAAAGARRAVVLGASFIGLEVAASLRARGLEVHVAAPDDIPLSRILGPEIGQAIRALHEARGVTFHLGRRSDRIDATGVVLDDGTVLAADFVVAGIGVRPNTALAEAAGLRTDNGIVVDAQLMTSAAGIYAAGDVARYPDRRSGALVRVEHWAAAQRQGRTAARNMLGLREPFHDIPFFWSQHYDLKIGYVGHAQRWDRIEIDGSIAAHDCTVRYIVGNRTMAVATMGRERQSLEIEAEMEAEVAGR